jgi:hypothetical protein
MDETRLIASFWQQAMLRMGIRGPFVGTRKDATRAASFVFNLFRDPQTADQFLLPQPALYSAIFSLGWNNGGSASAAPEYFR